MTIVPLGEAADAVVAKLRERMAAPAETELPDALDEASDGELLEMATELVAQLRIRLDMQADTIREAIDVIDRLRARLATGQEAAR